MNCVGIIGGSGLEKPGLVKNPKSVKVKTPFGSPSSNLIIGELEGLKTVIISRHGEDHSITPSGVNYRANIWALKEQGVTAILATTAVGSLREEIERGDMAIPSQFIDFTRLRNNTFFNEFKNGVARHTPMADPFHKRLSDILAKSCEKNKFRHHKEVTLVTIEGPRYSTRAESYLFRQWGADIINMSVATEVALANEVGIPYAALAVATDYDCWKEDEEPVTHEAVMAGFAASVNRVKIVLLDTLAELKKGSSI